MMVTRLLRRMMGALRRELVYDMEAIHRRNVEAIIANQRRLVEMGDPIAVQMDADLARSGMTYEEWMGVNDD